MILLYIINAVIDKYNFKSPVNYAEYSLFIKNLLSAKRND